MNFTSAKVEAAKKDPALKETQKSLYIGYETYKVQLSNLSKSAKVTYDTYDSSVASVSKSGVVTPISEGDTSIIAIVVQNNKRYRLKLTVFVLKPVIKITDSTEYLNISESYTFKAETTGITGNIGWYVSDATIANIGSDGKLNATAAGKVTVYAKAGNQTASFNLSVGSNRIGAFSNNISCYSKQTIWITVSDMMAGETLSVSNYNSELLEYEWGDKVNNKIPLTINPKKIGESKLTIASRKTDDKLVLNINIIEKPSKERIATAKDACVKDGAATVEVTSEYNGKQTVGTGFFIGDGVVVTNNHIIRGADKIYVKNINKVTYDVQTIIGYDEQTDLAILKVDCKNDYLSLNLSDYSVGNDVFTFSSPLGSGITAIMGNITNSTYVYENVGYIQISTPITTISSGGPLVDAYGDVIGINTVYDANIPNTNNVINIKELLKINTNRPMSLAEYKQKVQYDMQLNTPGVLDETYFNTTYINGLPSGSGISGTITKYLKADNFRIKINYACLLTAVCYFKNYADYQKATIDLSNENSVIINNGKSCLGTLSYKVTYQLSPGTYYLNIHIRGLSEDQDIPYTCYLSY